VTVVSSAQAANPREAEGMRPGGYGLLLASGTVDELIYSEIGNEVLLIKYVDSASSVDRA
jgi:anti-sigma regulatory factor (Ser/Thr protein kinase)